MRVLGLFGDYVQNTVLQSFLVLTESVLFPCIITHIDVKAMPDNTLLEQANEVLVVWLLLKLKDPTVLHELLELRRIPFAQLLQCGLDLLLLNIVILFIFASAWQALPRQASSKEIQEDMANRFQVISP